MVTTQVPKFCYDEEFQFLLALLLSTEMHLNCSLLLKELLALYPVDGEACNDIVLLRKPKRRAARQPPDCPSLDHAKCLLIISYPSRV